VNARGHRGPSGWPVCLLDAKAEALAYPKGNGNSSDSWRYVVPHLQTVMLSVDMGHPLLFDLPQQQVPCGNDRKKSNGKSKDKRRSFDYAPFGRFAQDDNAFTMTMC
jgi:hypothetical protein